MVVMGLPSETERLGFRYLLHPITAIWHWASHSPWNSTFISGDRYFSFRTIARIQQDNAVKGPGTSCTLNFYCQLLIVAYNDAFLLEIFRCKCIDCLVAKKMLWRHFLMLQLVLGNEKTEEQRHWGELMYEHSESPPLLKWLGYWPIRFQRFLQLSQLSPSCCVISWKCGSFVIC